MDGFTKFLNIADEIDIMIFKNDKTSLTLKAFVYDIPSDKDLVISNPVSEGNLYPMERQYEYYFRFYIENVGMYLFKGNVLNRITFDNLPAIQVKLISEIKRVQRRRFFRVRLMSHGNFFEERQLSDGEIEIMRQKLKKKFANEKDIIVDDTVIERIAFETLDLSGGGLRVETTATYQIGDFVEGEFIISGNMVKFKGEVTRCEKNASNRNEVGIRFLELDENTQSKIVAYVFEIERNFIKKGLI
jgi:c-di-GMP-binding flagellar brake protein YcgR